MNKVSVLFVCMGNICRSPTAEGVFRHLVRQEELEHLIQTDSAGTHAYHVGNPPDTRAQATAESRGIELHDLRARRVSAEDFDLFDYVLAMDQDISGGLHVHLDSDLGHVWCVHHRGNIEITGAIPSKNRVARFDQWQSIGSAASSAALPTTP